MGKTWGAPGRDADLVRAVQAGSREAFDQLVLRHQNRVFNLCYRFLGDYQDAKDSAQEAFIKAYRSLKNFRFQSKFSTWMYRIAVNTCKNRVKSAAYRHGKRQIPLGNPGGSASGRAAAEMDDPAGSPAEAVLRKERWALIQLAITELPHKQRAVLLLRDVEGFSYHEISTITGIGLGTVKSTLSRARTRLRQTLGSVIKG